MCQKCTDDNYDYTHLSDVAMMLTKAFQESGGQDLPIVADDNAGDVYCKVTHVSHDLARNRFKLHFEYGSRNKR